VGLERRQEWRDWKRVLERSWPGRVRTTVVGKMTSGELLTESSMLKDSVIKMEQVPHSGRSIYGRVSELQVAKLLAYTFEMIGTLMAYERILMPLDIPPEALFAAPAEFREALHELAG